MSSIVDDPVLDRMVETLVERFSPQRIVLFGSRARGDHHEESDYDLIVVLESAVPRPERDRPIREALAGRPVDVMVYTPAEYDRKRDDVGTFVYASEVEGRVLYDPMPSRWSRQVREEPQGVPESLATWLERAESDFATMELILAGSSTTDTLAFHGHQSSEKFLKAALVASWSRPPRTHILIDVHTRLPATLRDDLTVSHACEVLDWIWPSTRYPEDPMPKREQAEAAVDSAREIRDAVSRYLSSIGVDRK